MLHGCVRAALVCSSDLPIEAIDPNEQHVQCRPLNLNTISQTNNCINLTSNVTIIPFLISSRITFFVCFYPHSNFWSAAFFATWGG